MNATPYDFRAFSSELGNNFTLVQGAGGNTSLKDSGILFVKGSGTRLGDALRKNIFAEIPLSTNPLGDAFDSNGPLRPSIETSLHLLLPHRVVVHVHPTAVIALSVLKTAESIFDTIFSEYTWAYIPYVKPGITLARKVKEIIGKMAPDVLILANHGLVVGAESCEEASSLVSAIVSSVNKLIRPTVEFDLSHLSDTQIEGFVPAKFDSAHYAAYDDFALEVATGGSLYPDHVVFLRRGAIRIQNVEEIHNSRESDLVLLAGVGAFLPASASLAAHEMAAALGIVASQVPKDADINYLSREDEDALLDWDAEKHRQKLAE